MNVHVKLKAINLQQSSFIIKTGPISKQHFLIYHIVQCQQSINIYIVNKHGLLFIQ